MWASNHGAACAAGWLTDFTLCTFKCPSLAAVQSIHLKLKLGALKLIWNEFLQNVKVLYFIHSSFILKVPQTRSKVGLQIKCYFYFLHLFGINSCVFRRQPSGERSGRPTSCWRHSSALGEAASAACAHLAGLRSLRSLSPPSGHAVPVPVSVQLLTVACVAQGGVCRLLRDEPDPVGRRLFSSDALWHPGGHIGAVVLHLGAAHLPRGLLWLQEDGECVWCPRYLSAASFWWVGLNVHSLNLPSGCLLTEYCRGLNILCGPIRSLARSQSSRSTPSPSLVSSWEEFCLSVASSSSSSSSSTPSGEIQPPLRTLGSLISKILQWILCWVGKSQFNLASYYTH